MDIFAQTIECVKDGVSKMFSQYQLDMMGKPYDGWQLKKPIPDGIPSPNGDYASVHRDSFGALTQVVVPEGQPFAVVTDVPAFDKPVGDPTINEALLTGFSPLVGESIPANTVAAGIVESDAVVSFPSDAATITPDKDVEAVKKKLNPDANPK